MTDAARDSKAPASVRLSGSGGRTTPFKRLKPGELAAIWGLFALLMAEHLLFGGARREVALGFVAAQGAGLCLMVAAYPWTQEGLARLRDIRFVLIAFGLTIAVALWSLTPWVPGGAHPAWAYVQAWPSAALDRGGVLIELINLMGLACVFLSGWLIAADDDRARHWIDLTAMAFTAYGAWTFAAHLLDHHTIYGVIRKTMHDNRLTGSFFSANTAGTFLAMGAVFLTASLLDRLRSLGEPGAFSWEKLLNRGAWRMVGLAFCLAALILTASRSAVVSVALALVVFVVWEALARRWRLAGRGGLAIIGMLAVLAVLLLLGGTALFTRLLDVTENSDIRQQIFQAHWAAFLASPLMGYGLGSFDEVNRLVSDSHNLLALWNVRAGHNVYIQWLEEAGIIGAAPMFACIGLILLGMARSGRTRLATWPRAIVCLSLVLLAHGLTDFALQVPSVAAQWAALLGLGLSITHRRGRRA